MRRLCLLLLCVAALMSANAQETDNLIHTVEAGETLTAIAQNYGVTLEQLLSLNSLDPDAYLQIGQRLLVAPDAASGDAQPAGETGTDDPQEPREPTPDDSYPEAPVIEASAPMMDPADLQPLVCLVVYEDANHNGMREPAELRLRQGTIVLYDGAGLERARYTTDGESEPACLRDLGRQVYRLGAEAPAGYGLRGESELWLDLRAGGDVLLEFAARQGADLPAGPVSPAQDASDAPVDVTGGLLRELAGLALMAAAAAVMASGLILAVFLRSR